MLKMMMNSKGISLAREEELYIERAKLVNDVATRKCVNLSRTSPVSYQDTLKKINHVIQLTMNSMAISMAQKRVKLVVVDDFIPVMKRKTLTVYYVRTPMSFMIVLCGL